MSPTFPLLYAIADGHPMSKVWVQVEVNEPTSRKGLTVIRLHSGVVDETALEFFGYGGCCLLAGAMHERSGWPLLVFHSYSADHRILWVHMGVRAPGGEFLDITGRRSLHSLQEEYGHGCIQKVTLEEATAVGAIQSPSWESLITAPAFAEIIRYFADQLVGSVERTLADTSGA